MYIALVKYVYYIFIVTFIYVQLAFAVHDDNDDAPRHIIKVANSSAIVMVTSNFFFSNLSTIFNAINANDIRNYFNFNSEKNSFFGRI